MEVKKEPMAEVENEAPGQIIEDEEDGFDIESDEDDDEWDQDDDDEAGDDSLYSSPLDRIDEVLHLHTQLAKLQESGG